MKGKPVLHSTVEGSGRRVVLVHGFTQTLRSWDEVADRLAARYEVVRVDLPGHGASSEVRTDFSATAAVIGDCGGEAVYVGYSMGGRLCLRLALDRPDLARGLVLVSASPGLADAGDRAERRRADEALADEIERDGVVPFLDKWLSQPMFAGLSPPPAELEARRRNFPEGLAYALRTLGTGAQEPLWERLPTLAAPLLLIAGAGDGKFVAVAEQMAQAVVGRNADVAIAESSGHAVPLEQSERVAELIAAFVAETDG